MSLFNLLYLTRDLNDIFGFLKGDSGGPLSYYNPRLQVWFLAGTTSWGIGCGDPKQPGIYTKTSYFINWIFTVIGKAFFSITLHYCLLFSITISRKCYI